MRNRSSSKNMDDVQFTTDLDGNIIFYDLKEEHRKSINKKYPPSAMHYSV